jgi:hypothetical protein
MRAPLLREWAPRAASLLHATHRVHAVVSCISAGGILPAIARRHVERRHCRSPDLACSGIFPHGSGLFPPPQVRQARMVTRRRGSTRCDTSYNNSEVSPCNATYWCHWTDHRGRRPPCRMRRAWRGRARAR